MPRRGRGPGASAVPSALFFCCSRSDLRRYWSCSSPGDSLAMTLTYSSYLQLPELLELQQPRSIPPEHDEMLFIVIHQVFELWFKLLLHETGKVERDFSGNDLYGAIATWKRLRTILKTLVGQLDILETMTPMSFASFRDRLDTASGFQSFQFREIEFAFGYKRAQVTGSMPEGEGQRV